MIDAHWVAEALNHFRQAGNTTAALNGVKNTDHSLLVCVDKRQADDINKRHGSRVAATISEALMPGSRHAIVFDAHVVEMLASQSVSETDRANTAIRQLETARRRAEDWQARAERAEAELAKRERALEEAEDYHIEYIHQQIVGSTIEESVAFAAAKAPNYAEWLKNREEKK